MRRPGSATAVPHLLRFEVLSARSTRQRDRNPALPATLPRGVATAGLSFCAPEKQKKNKSEYGRGKKCSGRDHTSCAVGDHVNNIGSSLSAGSLHNGSFHWQGIMGVSKDRGEEGRGREKERQTRNLFSSLSHSSTALAGLHGSSFLSLRNSHWASRRRHSAYDSGSGTRLPSWGSLGRPRATAKALLVTGQFPVQGAKGRGGGVGFTARRNTMHHREARTLLFTKKNRHNLRSPEMETFSRWRPHPPCASARIPMSPTPPAIAVLWNSCLGLKWGSPETEKKNVLPLEKQQKAHRVRDATKKRPATQKEENKQNPPQET